MLTLEQRFRAKVVEDPGGCHFWVGAIRTDGYGVIGVAGKVVAAHRVAYELFVGEIGQAQVLHTCDNRHCVNPEHLWLGTQRDNMVDMYQKKRHTRDSKREWCVSGRHLMAESRVGPRCGECMKEYRRNWARRQRSSKLLQNLEQP